MLVTILGIVITLRSNKQKKKRDKDNKDNLKNIIREELRRNEIIESEELVSEIIKLSKRRIKIERVESEESDFLSEDET
jgi:glycerol-3-phosphate cytidylyltransferase-like family protein